MKSLSECSSSHRTKSHKHSRTDRHTRLHTNMKNILTNSLVQRLKSITIYTGASDASVTYWLAGELHTVWKISTQIMIASRVLKSHCLKSGASDNLIPPQQCFSNFHSLRAPFLHNYKGKPTRLVERPINLFNEHLNGIGLHKYVHDLGNSYVNINT